MIQLSTKQRQLICIALLAGLVTATCFYFANRGYGKVSYPAYQVATALYGGCLAKSENRIERIELLLAENSETLDIDSISERELKWLRKIISKAKTKNWDSAAASAKRMMDDQLIAQ